MSTLPNTPQSIPSHLLPFLGPFGIVEVDRAAQVPIAWGYAILKPVGVPGWAELSLYGKMVFDPLTKTWSLATKILTDDEAISQYGPLNKIERGPRGGFRSVCFGTTIFTSKLLQR